jgi:hypothetical protein
MDVLAGVGFMALLVVSAGVWMYGSLHPLLNHGKAGMALVVLLMPWTALFYVALHRCPRDETA